jgi:lycopene cyclase domain-containing protein
MKEYTMLTAASVAVVLLLDVLLRTRVIRRKAFWAFLGVMYFFKLIFNGWLTWRPIVIYGEGMYLGVRIGTIPVEDFFFGFSMMALTVILWEYLNRRGREIRP